jgi:hypothetical protein
MAGGRHQVDRDDYRTPSRRHSVGSAVQAEHPDQEGAKAMALYATTQQASLRCVGIRKDRQASEDGGCDYHVAIGARTQLFVASQ